MLIVANSNSDAEHPHSSAYSSNWTWRSPICCPANWWFGASDSTECAPCNRCSLLWYPDVRTWLAYDMFLAAVPRPTHSKKRKWLHLQRFEKYWCKHNLIAWCFTWRSVPRQTQGSKEPRTGCPAAGIAWRVTTISPGNRTTDAQKIYLFVTKWQECITN
jgi:hypothetical protein